MKRTTSLDDLALLLAVADAGGLAKAADVTGVSVPTLSRRMTALEQDMGRRLFERGPRGYRLTADGRAVVAEAEALRGVANRFAALRADAPAPRVRVTAGMWTARFLARTLSVAADAFRLDYMASNVRVDLARREADIGVRNARPDQPWLAGRHTATICYAFYGVNADVQRIATRPPEGAPTPSERWLRDACGDAERVFVNDPRLGLDLARSGQARVLVPTFVGEAEQGLVRLGDVVQELTHEEWLISHHEARHDPPVRAALDRIAAVLTDRELRS